MSYFLLHEPSQGIGGNSVNITKDVRKYATKQGVSEQGALSRGMDEKMDEKIKEFVESGVQVYKTASCSTSGSPLLHMALQPVHFGPFFRLS